MDDGASGGSGQDSSGKSLGNRRSPAGFGNFKTYDFSISDELTEKTLRSTIDDYKTFGLIDNKKSTDELVRKVWTPVMADRK